MRTTIFAAAWHVLLLLSATALAHDTWVQTNTNVVRAGDIVHVDLMLGNHGNDHRDFKLAGKTSLEGATLQVINPAGAVQDLMPALVDTGYGEKDGYWSARVQTGEPGLYVIAHTSDRVVSYAPMRSIKSGKTFFVASKSLDAVPVVATDSFSKPLGQVLELVPQSNPVTPMGPGTPIEVQLLFKGQPLANARVSFIPRGRTLSEGFDETYERWSDESGKVSFEPTEANYYLVVAHHEDPAATGDGHAGGTKYSTTLTVLVPGVAGSPPENAGSR